MRSGPPAIVAAASSPASALGLAIRQREEPALAGDALQGMDTSILENVMSGARGEIPRRLGDQDVVRAGRTEDPGSLVDRESSNAITNDLDLAHVDGARI